MGSLKLSKVGELMTNQSQHFFVKKSHNSKSGIVFFCSWWTISMCLRNKIKPVPEGVSV